VAKPPSLLRFRHASIRTHMLLIALVPALLTELGLVGYFANRSITAAEHVLSERASNAAHHLASTLPYALVSGNDFLVKQMLQTEQILSQLAYAVVFDAKGKRIAAAADSRIVSATNPASLLASSNPSTSLRTGMADASKDAPSEMASAWNRPGLLRQD